MGAGAAPATGAAAGVAAFAGSAAAGTIAAATGLGAGDAAAGGALGPADAVPRGRAASGFAGALGAPGFSGERLRPSGIHVFSIAGALPLAAAGAPGTKSEKFMGASPLALPGLAGAISEKSIAGGAAAGFAAPAAAALGGAVKSRSSSSPAADSTACAGFAEAGLAPATVGLAGADVPALAAGVPGSGDFFAAGSFFFSGSSFLPKIENATRSSFPQKTVFENIDPQVCGSSFADPMVAPCFAARDQRKNRVCTTGRRTGATRLSSNANRPTKASRGTGPP